MTFHFLWRANEIRAKQTGVAIRSMKGRNRIGQLQRKKKKKTTTTTTTTRQLLPAPQPRSQTTLTKSSFPFLFAKEKKIKQLIFLVLCFVLFRTIGARPLSDECLNDGENKVFGICPAHRFNSESHVNIRLSRKQKFTKPILDFLPL
jgi:hypothetical protein